MPELLVAFLDWLRIYRVALTEPGFQNLLVVGWVQTTGRHAGTQSLVATDVAKRRPSRGVPPVLLARHRNPDRLGYWLFERVRGVLDLDQHGLRV